MYEWNEAIQKMIDWIEEHITENPSLLEMSGQIGYSPYYCSVQFHKMVGMTIKNYVSGRKMALAAQEIRDTDSRIIDIAVKYGFSSQEALTRAFRGLFGCTPAAYRKNPLPVPFPIRKVIYFPEHYHELYEGGVTMSETVLTQARERVTYIPAHKYIGIWDENALGYGDFWNHHNCDEVCGIINSLSHICDPIITGHTAGWFCNEKGERRYFYGIGMPVDYNGPVPEGFEMKWFPGSYYKVFYHPPFDYLKDNGEVMGRVENMAWNYDLENEGGSSDSLGSCESRRTFEWNEDVCQCYQRHYPEGIGYEILRPIRMK